MKLWRAFFKAGGVKDAPTNGVEVFAENYADEKLGEKGYSVTPVDKLKIGYDRKAKTPTGDEIHIEVKGQSHDQDVELKGNELEAAEAYKDAFYLCVVTGIPENPSMHFLKNPAAVGTKEKVTIPAEVWKSALAC